MQPTLRIHIIAVTAGLFVGVVLQEILLSIFDVLNSGFDLNRAIAGLETDGGWVPVLLIGWAVGGFSAGMMASMISQNLTSGCVAGALMMLPALMLAQHAFDSVPLAALFTITPLTTAALGSWLAGRLLGASEATENASG